MVIYLFVELDFFKRSKRRKVPWRKRLIGPRNRGKSGGGDFRRTSESKRCLFSSISVAFFLLVRSAWAFSNGCKSWVSPNSGNYMAKCKSVHREVKSEESRRQTFDLTNRNFIQGFWPWIRLHLKSNSLQKTLSQVNGCPQRDRSETEWYGGV